MSPLLLSGSGNRPLALAMAKVLGIEPGECHAQKFPDGELEVRVGEVRERDVFIVQPTSPPVGERLLELLLIADACRRGGAARVTAVVPYLGYARQDRRERSGEPLGARVVADLLAAGGLDRLVAMDLHSPSVESAFHLPVEQVSSVDVLAERLGRVTSGERVVVSPDLGAVKRARAVAKRLSLPVAVVYKQRLSGSEVEASDVVGEVRGRSPILVDDIISTAGTMAAAAEVLLHAGCNRDITLAACHGLFVGPAVERLAHLPITRVVTTDSTPPPAGLALPLELVSVAPVLADAVRRLGRR